jgi:hypothetical protein
VVLRQDRYGDASQVVCDELLLLERRIAVDDGAEVGGIMWVELVCEVVELERDNGCEVSEA